MKHLKFEESGELSYIHTPSNNYSALNLKSNRPDKVLLLELETSTPHYYTITQYYLSQSQEEYLRTPEGKDLLKKFINHKSRDTKSVFTSIKVGLYEPLHLALDRYELIPSFGTSDSMYDFTYQYKRNGWDTNCVDKTIAPMAMRPIFQFFSDSKYSDFNLLSVTKNTTTKLK